MQRRRFRNRYFATIWAVGFGVAGAAWLPLIIGGQPAPEQFVSILTSAGSFFLAYRFARASLRVDETGICVRGIRHTQTVPWGEVASFSFGRSQMLRGILVVVYGPSGAAGSPGKRLGAVGSVVACA